ncbi:hypothetical protein [Vagococcus sp. WN89Y]|uniref:hypothetical protein n=1 Tax=Vagococcus sp. WN89Y TaxID=3457258 RepID=UPI003FCE8E07
MEQPLTFAFFMHRENVPSTHSQFVVTNSDVATSHVEGTLPALPKRDSITFTVSINSPDGTLTT